MALAIKYSTDSIERERNKQMVQNKVSENAIRLMSLSTNPPSPESQLDQFGFKLISSDSGKMIRTGRKRVPTAIDAGTQTMTVPIRNSVNSERSRTSSKLRSRIRVKEIPIAVTSRVRTAIED